jgi:L-iditol 2-dehydrogenase
MKMKAAVIESGKTITVRDIQCPGLPPGGAIIRVKGCGICGSDLDKLLHRDLADGTVLGHEVVGVIETLSDEAKDQYPHLQVGQRVSVAHHVPCQQCHYCRHGSPSMCRTFKKSNIEPGGFSELIAVSKEHLAHTVFAIPDGVPDEAASCIEPLACCVRAVDRIPPDVGEHVLVVGLGFIGLMTAQYFQHQGFSTHGVDLKPERVSLACEHDMIQYADASQEVVLETLFAQTQGRGADVVFLSIVNPAALNLAMKAVRDGGTLVLFASHGEEVPLINQNELYFRELTVLTSYSPSLQHLQKAYDLIVNNQVRVDPLMSHVYPLNALAQAMEAYRTGQALKVFITL